MGQMQEKSLSLRGMEGFTIRTVLPQGERELLQSIAVSRVMAHISTAMETARRVNRNVQLAETFDLISGRHWAVIGQSGIGWARRDCSRVVYACKASVGACGAAKTLAFDTSAYYATDEPRLLEY